MQTVPLGVSSIATLVNNTDSFSIHLSLSLSLSLSFKSLKNPFYSFPNYSFKSLKNPFYSFPRIWRPDPEILTSLSPSFPRQSVDPEIVIREARLQDSWEVAETHCSSFFPKYRFPYDFMLRINRVVGMLLGRSTPSGCNRTCLVAVIGSSDQDALSSASDASKIGFFDGSFSLNKGYVVGILTVDTLAAFLPRKGPLQQRRAGIAYISNVAVREKFRRRGIAKRLIAKAEAKARSWGCHAIALHSDLNDPGVSKLYQGLGFKCIKVPEGANWPHPKSSRDVQVNFMMKLLNPLIKSQIV